MHTDNISVTEEPYMAVRSYSTSIGGIALSALPVQFRFVQLDHHGGFCDCWAVANIIVTPPNGQATKLLYVSHFSKLNYRPLKLFCRDTVHFSKVCGGNTTEALESLLEIFTGTVSNQILDDSIIAGFCGDNEGIPQVFIAQFGGTPPLQGFRECNSSESLPLEPTTEDEGTDVTTTNFITPIEGDVITTNIITTEDEDTDVTTTNIITITEDEGTDVTTTNIIMMNTVILESAIRDSIIIENRNFSSVLVQVWYQQEIYLAIYPYLSLLWNMNKCIHAHAHIKTQ